MSKIKIATSLGSAVKRIVKSFSMSEKDLNTGLKVWRDELDYAVEGKKVGQTNSYVTDLNNKPLKIFEYDLADIKRRDGNAPDKVTKYDFIEATSKVLKKYIRQGLIKFILDDDNKEDLVKAIKDGLISKNNNLITNNAVAAKQVEIVPNLDKELSLEDKEITSMKDIKASISKAKQSQIKEINDELKDLD